MLISFLPIYANLAFNPELFTFLIIAPLMYIEVKSASRYWIGRGAINILSLAIILVALTILILGLIVNNIYNALPLSLAFALIAIVTPTDAAAVSSISAKTARFKIPQIILKNESLFNDASGIVLFELALTTYVSGKFSMQGAITDFLREFLGGLLLAKILG